ncbi:hypothetical protein pmac_cds_112 [Pandoravirus macleodensis]|uniref:Uncharacterized protein n=1 Tax=Pandoravirus macleodensis TaxID=2107707 RepID=A0A2U7UEQ0_9VIRU|nr:hypothetical protein pmac_cds_112 [Pandoravirus macleodensis]AVK76800.1 hypothetical protein pmac_cds_112 [Pandoravirus macleodensis]
MAQENEQGDPLSSGAAPREGVLASLLRQAGVAADVRAAFRDMPLSRVLDAFACAKCARPDGHALCLADQIDHRKRRWKAMGHCIERADDNDDGDDDGDDDSGDGHTCDANASDKQEAQYSVPLALAGYEDGSLMGACIRAIVPVNVVFTIIEAILFQDHASAVDHVRVCADRQMMARRDRPAMRLCRPVARDRLRLRAWAWADSVARQRTKRWRSDAHAFGPCWEAIARPCDLPSDALVLSISTDAEGCYCQRDNAANMAREFQANEDTAARDPGRLERVERPYDPRIVGFIESPFWSHCPTVFRVRIGGDSTFAIAAEW